MAYFWLGREAEDIEPYCDGDLPEMECVESDGFITCYFSGPIQPLPASVEWVTRYVFPKS